jgi:diadenosine tetraphosphate (Ap4A) HIT family hydrolase
MASVFTMIINGELPARFVWKDDRCVAFLSINPLTDGHVLVVPREEIDHWLDADDDLLTHLMTVSRTIGEAIQRAYDPAKVGMMIAGLEVPHLHVHLAPINGLPDLNFANADPSPAPERLDHVADTLRGALRELGHPEVDA